MRKTRKETGLTVVMALLGIAAASVLAYDIWTVATAHVDMNRHWPFLVPAVFAAFVIILATIRRHLRICPDHVDR